MPNKHLKKLNAVAYKREKDFYMSLLRQVGSIFFVTSKTIGVCKCSSFNSFGFDLSWFCAGERSTEGLSDFYMHTNQWTWEYFPCQAIT